MQLTPVQPSVITLRAKSKRCAQPGMNQFPPSPLQVPPQPPHHQRVMVVIIFMKQWSGVKCPGLGGRQLGDMDEGFLLVWLLSLPHSALPLPWRGWPVSPWFVIITVFRVVFVLSKELSFYTNRWLLNQLMRLKRSFIIGNCIGPQMLRNCILHW